MRVSARVVGVVLAAVVGLGLTGCEPPNSYVALGDSYTAGPGITPQDPGFPGCLRSDANFPNLIAPDLAKPAFRDVSCSGAQTKHMTEVQGVDPDPDNPPQFTALDKNTEVVTLGIGGNDIGFSSIATTCGNEAVEHNFQGSPCKDYYAGRPEAEQPQSRIAALAPKLRAVLDGIDARSPRAKVFVVGYPAILPENNALFLACQPTLPVAEGDLPFLRDDVEKYLNAVIQYTTVGHGEVYVDTYTSSIGHDACKAPGIRWVEPVVPAADAAPVHPNRLGMENTAEAVRVTMRANGVPVS
ncbi:SGNH/GDSL hydrolase family protein [soil metagenome]